MAATEKRTFSLPAEQAAFIDHLVKSGTYATSSEVIRAGLRALQERDAAVERWLREEVVPTYDRWKADPKGISTEEMAERSRKRHEARLQRDA
ncbi:type II toxin-antitoxin system ParD family antitoxin [Mesorhizobium sp. M7A.F.Ca.CA.001.09.2.1]|uniref:Type II toxin-antitoxin system ParD family antitoxin n=1 Tax=Mesorhizobium ciceri TaxID=39645 RepID=A0AB38TCA6_9HYPH|nr:MULTISPECIES: type II toxin-antitoxin system ParD family antitoxin [Mesorhizobium]RUY55433.1 type II toxin-antitoxin system ParD family antitoxin [Mesorhizobium sp. M7A.F.Ca.CA.001.13.2.1]MDF3213773.1 type II toxin-antitoxin system ParD family antitoxin [Mesorhizobium ciceri]RUY64095.1 type II toxin-antitoxin system ParD family antitoxin [Mesorhizobium sp. M7A.F.Ca.CA.001.05.1.1]RUY70044.1 type II toxin-antitoxin system ParD family antitoxin [Mesorhizobium sp. M7A.F.Ca.CA.001.13.1.1]RUY8142